MPRLVLRIFTWSIFIALIVGSLQPARPSLVSGIHRQIHWLAFGVAALLLFCLSRGLRQEILSGLGACLLGLSLEVLQHLIYRNRMEWRDVVDDDLAILVAFALYRLAGARKHGFPPRP